MTMNARDITSDFPVAASGNAQSIYNRFFKRWLDVVLAVVLLPLLLPVIAVLFVLVRRDGGPGIYGHQRLGRGGQPFVCYKLRTMAVNAEALLEDLLARDPEARREWDDSHKLKDDPRVTRLGRFLRRTSLDELPQLFNVLKGDMSLVGPRPIVRDELARYGSAAWAYLELRPGITGKWQVSGRNDVTYEERVELDLRYNREVGLVCDLSILARTAKVLLFPTGY